MDILTKSEIKKILMLSSIIEEYNEELDRESAYEILSAKLDDFIEEENQGRLRRQRGRPRREKTVMEQVLDSSTGRQIGRTIARELTRGILDVMGIKKTRRRRSKKTPSWF